jgi:glucose/arabinose dehydrogenase
VIFVALLSFHGCGSEKVPPPIVDRPAGNCPEIFASGLRNPWRWSFDRQTGALWVGDVGQGRLEEIDRVTRGGNYGWRCFEGTLPVGLPCGSEPNLLAPVAEYGRNEGRSVTGGYVYRGSAMPSLAGRYVFGDYVTGRIWHIAGNTQPTAVMTGGFVAGFNISSFGEGNDGELHVVNYNDGQLFRLTGDVNALGVVRVFPNLSFTAPIAMLQAPGDSSRWFVVEQGGVVRVFANNQAAATATEFVNITGRVASGGEMGLLGMAFHPDFPKNPRVYLSYTNATAGRVSRISEFTLTAGGSALDPNSERILLVVNQPESNHNGGQIAFGPDGYLYIGMGDGGGGNDMHGAIGNGQLMSTLLGKMLRIDVNGALPYGIPADNPFAGHKPCGANS